MTKRLLTFPCRRQKQGLALCAISVLIASAIDGVFPSWLAVSLPTPSSIVKEEDPVAPFRGLRVPYLANGSQSVLKHFYECDPLVMAPWVSKHKGIEKVLPIDKLFGKKILFLGNSHTRQLYVAFVSTFSLFVTNITRNRIEHVVPFQYKIEGFTNVINVSFAFQSEAIVVYNTPLFYQPNVSKLEELIGRPFADFDVIVLGYVNPSHHCQKYFKNCPKDIQTNFLGIASRFQKDADLLMVNMFGRGEEIHGYSTPNPNPNPNSYYSFREQVHRNYAFVDVSKVPFCSHKSCADSDGHQCNNPGPPNIAAWHLIDCMKPSSNATNCQKVKHSGG